MKRFAVITVILLLAAQAQAQTDAPPHKTKMVVPPKPLALRGAQSPVPTVKTATPPASSWAARSANAAQSDPSECRMACAHSYYFCLAGGDASDCPQSWTSCQSACANPTLAIR